MSLVVSGPNGSITVSQGTNSGRGSDATFLNSTADDVHGPNLIGPVLGGVLGWMFLSVVVMGLIRRAGRREPRRNPWSDDVKPPSSSKDAEEGRAVLPRSRRGSGYGATSSDPAISPLSALVNAVQNPASVAPSATTAMATAATATTTGGPRPLSSANAGARPPSQPPRASRLGGAVPMPPAMSQVASPQQQQQQQQQLNALPQLNPPAAPSGQPHSGVAMPSPAAPYGVALPAMAYDFQQAAAASAAAPQPAAGALGRPLPYVPTPGQGQGQGPAAPSPRV
ncbi:hypothetical protein CXG81DRAFT_17168 [Caulochytrium protostelioides]|uniref:Uncharacterized protein n=1 Tax=Caulochytrium protostelioides TaxID=1555241 RepID=A0A4V1IV99_9FUNG|nr:hypothetical protein CXG81DRAFT_17168 [Caulochytrium protostelioides]|eukprot:RKP03319.1 hypothetical protein CXG81DRAFT_17168 [Caulochytrium protostelioides]